MQTNVTFTCCYIGFYFHLNKTVWRGWGFYALQQKREEAPPDGLQKYTVDVFKKLGMTLMCTEV